MRIFRLFDDKYTRMAAAGFALLLPSSVNAVGASRIVPPKVAAGFDCHFSDAEKFPVFFFPLKPKVAFFGIVLCNASARSFRESLQRSARCQVECEAREV